MPRLSLQGTKRYKEMMASQDEELTAVARLVTRNGSEYRERRESEKELHLRRTLLQPTPLIVISIT